LEENLFLNLNPDMAKRRW